MALFKRKGGEKGEAAAAEKPKPPEQDWKEERRERNAAVRQAVPQTLILKMRETAGEKPKIAEIQLSLKEATYDMGTKRLRYENADGSVKVHFTHSGYRSNHVSFQKFAGKELEFGFSYDVGDLKNMFLSLHSFGVVNLQFVEQIAGLWGQSQVTLVIPHDINEMRNTLKAASDKADEIRRIHDEVGGAVCDALKPLASQVLPKLEELP